MSMIQYAGRDSGTKRVEENSDDRRVRSLPKGRTGESIQILMAEDEPDLLRLGAGILRSKGYQVEAAENGWDAWNMLQRQSFHLLLTDNHMDRLTGMGLIRKLDAAGINIPVILATASKPPEELGKNPWLNIEILLLKPFTAEELMRAVEQVVGRTQHSTVQNLTVGGGDKGAARVDHPDENR
jgi:CheY-like chemotaxis protein